MEHLGRLLRFFCTLPLASATIPLLGYRHRLTFSRGLECVDMLPLARIPQPCCATGRVFPLQSDFRSSTRISAWDTLASF